MTATSLSRTGVPGRTVRTARRPGRTEAPPRPITAAAIGFVVAVLSRFPLRLLHGLARILGRVLWTVLRCHRQTTLENLAIAFPRMSAAQRLRLGKRSSVHGARMLLELPAIWNWPRERLLASVREVHGEELVRDAMAERRGVIIASLHLGAFEICTNYVAIRHGLCGQYREPRIRELADMMRAARNRFGARALPAGGASVKLMLRALRQGEPVMMLCDHDPGDGGSVFVPFFGRLARTMTLVSRLAARSNAAVIFAYARRLPRSSGFAVHFRPAPEELSSRDVVGAAAALNRGIEECILDAPEQYLWSYKRYRIRPELSESRTLAARRRRLS